MYMTLPDTKEYSHNVYLITNPDYHSLNNQDEVLVQVVDAGNTIQTHNGVILGHYVGTH